MSPSHKPTKNQPTAYYVYVVALEGLPVPSVYVGYSSQPPLERFRRHKLGDKQGGSRYVRRYGVQLLPEHYAGLNPLPTRQAARQAEQRLRRGLEAKGFRVYGACVVGRERGCRI